MSQNDQKWQQLGDHLNDFQAAGDPQADFAHFQQLLQQQKLVKAWWQRPYFWLNTFLIMTLFTATAFGLSLLVNSGGSNALTGTSPTSTSLPTTPTEQGTSVEAPLSSLHDEGASTTLTEDDALDLAAATSTTLAGNEPRKAARIDNTTSSPASAATAPASQSATDPSLQPESSNDPIERTGNSNSEEGAANLANTAEDNDGKNTTPPATNASQDESSIESTNQRLSQIPNRSILPLDIPQQLPAPNASPMDFTDPFRRENTNFLLQAHLGLSFHLPNFNKLSFDPGAYAAISAHYRLNTKWEVGGRVGVAVHSLNFPNQPPPISEVERTVSWVLPSGFENESTWEAQLQSINIISLAASSRYSINGRLRASFGLQFARLIGESSWRRFRRGNSSNLDPFRELTDYPIRQNNWAFLFGMDYRLTEKLGLEIMATPSLQDITPNEYDEAQHTSTSIAVGLSVRF